MAEASNKVTDLTLLAAMLDHLQAMAEASGDTSCKISIVSSAMADNGNAIFAIFAYDGTPQACVYYPADDILFTPDDWQGAHPQSIDDIPRYCWHTSAGDDAVVVNGYPRVFAPMRDAARKDFGRRLRAHREAIGLTQAELARRAGLLRTHIGRIECGRYSVSLDTITRLSAALGVDLA